jgi:hypothetical protein
MKLRIVVSLVFVAALCVLYASPAPMGAQNPAPPALPATPAVPVIPAVPASPGMPVFPALPAMPAMPSMPALPELPALPALAALPELPELPELPALPDFSGPDDDWGNRHSVSISGGHGQPINDCSDLHVRFNDLDAVMKSEEHTVSKAEASTLSVRPHKNGGVQVQGWDKDTYSVTACKAASNEEGNAEVILSQIRVGVQNGEVSTDGPSNDKYDWTVFLLIRTPKSATLDLETTNGPLSFYGVDGKLTARATNGPISLHDFSGQGTVEATNGPITISGGSGNLNIHTTNGPISINLRGTNWNGTGLSADAQNGPLTLYVPSGYQSSFLVEASRSGPISCRASICDNARKTWDEDHRRIEFGSSPAMIHVSTVNGPVSVQSPREEM